MVKSSEDNAASLVVDAIFATHRYHERNSSNACVLVYAYVYARKRRTRKDRGMIETRSIDGEYFVDRRGVATTIESERRETAETMAVPAGFPELP